jgi:hypothetical protein
MLNEPVEIEESILDGDKIVTKKRIGIRAELIARRLVTEASSKYTMGSANAQLGAAQELRKVTEPTEEEKNAASGGGDREFTRILASLFIDRLPQRAQVVEIPS